jgi:hypothetical protein
MNLISFILITILVVALCIVLLKFFFGKIHNIIHLQRPSKLTDHSEREHGLIYNPISHKLEADQSVITPF